MLWVGNKKVGKLWVGKKSVSVLWCGTKKIWEAISSCFGSGIWRKEQPWKGQDAWKQ